MTLGPGGKYDKIAEELLYRLNAGLVLVEVINGSCGSGFSIACHDRTLMPSVPATLERVAATCRHDLGSAAKLPDLYGYVGEDELGSGMIGLKQGVQKDGNVTPLVCVEEHHQLIRHPEYLAQLQYQANRSGKEITLVRYMAVEECLLIKPE